MPADEQTVDDAKRKIRHACGRYVIGKIDGDQMIGEITAVILAISPNEMNKFADWISRATELWMPEQLPSLITHRPEIWAWFVSKIALQACEDHQNKRKRRSGEECVRLYAWEWRNRHCRLASTIYNKIRDELETPTTE